MFAYRIAIACLAACLMASCAGMEDEAVTPQLLIDQREDAIVSAADVKSINGIYTNCVGHNNNDPWSLKVDVTGTLDNALLAIAKGDPACVLTLTGLKSGAFGTLAAVPSIAMTTSYAGTAAAFGAPDFYANAKLTGDFTSGFTITLQFSPDAAGSSGNNTAGYTLLTPSVALGGGPTPDYSIDMSAVVVTKNAGGVVQSVIGNVYFRVGPNAYTGDFYVSLTGAAKVGYTNIKNAYNAGPQVAMATSIPASSLLANGLTLPQSRVIIIGKTVAGVVTCEQFAITFN